MPKRKKHGDHGHRQGQERDGQTRSTGQFQPLYQAADRTTGLESRTRDRVTLKIYTEEPIPGLHEMKDRLFTGPAPETGVRICKEYANLTAKGIIEQLAAKGLFYVGGNYKRHDQGAANYMKFARENGRPLETKFVSTVLRNSLESLQLHKFEVFAKSYHGSGRLDLVKLYAGEPESGDRLHRIVVGKKRWAIEPA